MDELFDASNAHLLGTCPKCGRCLLPEPGYEVARDLIDEIERLRAGWKEAAIAWEVCASVHEQWAKKKDALYSTRHGDFVKHAADARAKLTYNAKLTGSGTEAIEAWNTLTPNA